MSGWDDFLDDYDSDPARGRFEMLFARQVLARVGDLDPDDVQAEHPFKDVGGGNRRIDFAIVEGEHVRIAIEVDGFDKRNRGSGMTSPEFEDWSKRELSLVALGFDVLRFANTYVRDHSAQCIRILNVVLKRARAVAAELERATEAHRRLTEAEHQAVADAVLTVEDKKVLAEADKDNDSGFADLEDKLRAALERAEQAEGQVVEHEQRWESMGKIVTAMAAVFIAALIAIVVVVTRDNGSSPAIVASACGGALTWNEATSHIGESTTVEGKVVDPYYDRSGSHTTFLNIGNPRKNSNRFVVVIFSRSRKNFPSAPEAAFAGKTMCAVGTIGEFKGIPQIIANDPSDVFVP